MRTLECCDKSILESRHCASLNLQVFCDSLIFNAFSVNLVIFCVVVGAAAQEQLLQGGAPQVPEALHPRPLPRTGRHCQNAEATATEFLVSIIFILFFSYRFFKHIFDHVFWFLISPTLYRGNGREQMQSCESALIFLRIRIQLFFAVGIQLKIFVNNYGNLMMSFLEIKRQKRLLKSKKP